MAALFTRNSQINRLDLKKRWLERKFWWQRKQRLIYDRADYCPYESKNRQVLKIGDKRYDDGYTCEDYMDEWVVIWNSYARFAGDVIEFQNRTAFDLLELYQIANQTAGTVEALRVWAIEFARDMHASEVRRARELATLSF